MRAPSFLGPTFAAAVLLGLGTATAAPADPSCLAGCNDRSLSADDQATCRLQCNRLSQETSPSPAPRPAPPTAAPATSAPASPPAPAQPTAAQQHERALCEAKCDAEPIVSDRATCRLFCGQLTRVAAPASTPGTASPGSYSFPPGGGPLPTAAPTTNPAQPQQQIAACQSTCDREVSPTDRATCRNNCAAVGTVVGPAAPSQWVLGPAPATSEADQRAAVIRASSGVVAQPAQPRPSVQFVAPTTPTGQPTPANATQCAAQAQSCGGACTSEQSTCAAQCDQGKLSETDRATCKLTCESNGDMCRDDCRIKEAGCRGPTYR